MKNKGFTLIELLVVISIISLLSTVVMSSLQSARIKAQESAIKSDLLSIKTQAELSYSKKGDYSLVGQEIDPILKHINANGGTAAFYTLVYGSVSYYDHYAVSVKFNSNTSKNWSVSDRYGIATWDNSDGANADWPTAQNNCATPVGGMVGRLPTIEELKSFYNTYGGERPPGFKSSSYWSSNIWSVNVTSTLTLRVLSNGAVDSNYNGSPGPVYLSRCVR